MTLAEEELMLPVRQLSEMDDNIPKSHSFEPVRPVGVHLPAEVGEVSPEKLFKLYFSSDIVQYICAASNESAERVKCTKPGMYKYYKGMSEDDFYKVVGILIHLGYRRIPQYRFAWSPSSLCFDPVISKIMSRNRFEGLLSFLHVVDGDTEKRLQEEGDKLAKVRPLNDHLQSKCVSLYQPNREISIDERMVRSKARFSFRQYIRNKPTKWGFKLWCLCDSHNGYTSAFSVYRGKRGEVRSGNGLGYDVVMKLITEYLSQGYSLYVDNFYTSPTLISDLYSLGVHVTGTLDSSRIGVHKEVSLLKKKFSSQSVPRGQGVYIRDGIHAYAIWKDTKCISVMSSEHPGHSDQKVVRNCKDKDGKRLKQDVPIPIMVQKYNCFMSGVDRSDQMIKYYNVLRQTKKYWKTLFFHYVDVLS